MFLKGLKIELKHCNQGNLELFVKSIKYINQSNDVIILTNGTVLEQVKERGDSVLRRWKTEISHEDGASKSDVSKIELNQSKISHKIKADILDFSVVF